MAVFKEYKKKDGTKAWQFQAYLGIDEVTGKEVRTTRRGFSSKKEAQQTLNSLVVDFEKNGLQKVKITLFNEVYEMWFDSYKNTVKESTWIATERYFKLHILPVLGESRVDKIDMKACQKAVNKWAKDLIVFKTVTQYATKVMDYAINLELIAANPFAKVIRPVKTKECEEPKIKFYTLDELKTVFDYLDSKVMAIRNGYSIQKYYTEFDRMIFRLLSFSGLRVGEALCLTWSDIDLKANTLTVSKTLSKTKEGYKVSTPKTKSSNRVISLDDKTIGLLKRWQLRQKEVLFSYGVTKPKVVFTDINGDYMTRQDVYQRATRLASACGLHNIGTHGYRHTHASMLFESGVTMKEAQERLGHSSIEMTMDVYTHLTQKTKEKTAEKLAKYADF